MTTLEELGLARSPGSIMVLVVDDDPNAVELLAAYPAEPGFDVVQELKGSSEAAAILIVVVTAKSLTAEDHASLNGYMAAILEKAGFNHGHFVRELRRALTLR